MPAKMHADEFDTAPSVVRRLLAFQFPQWADLPIEQVESTGTDFAIYRLGNDMCVRLPRIRRAVAQVEKEEEWLPRLAPHVPLAIPLPLARGEAAEVYPWRWSICQWLPGEDAIAGRIGDLRRAAIDLARFIADLQRIDSRGGPPPGEHNWGRGAPLATRDDATRTAIASLSDEIDGDAATGVWNVALEASSWSRTPVWIHGDLIPGNLLVQRGKLTGVIDFGGLGVGDPACDLIAAWTLFSNESRAAFRETLSLDDATWMRGKGWALSWALIFIPYYKDTNPTGVEIARRTIREVLADM